jgi:hypothetical protein
LSYRPRRHAADAASNGADTPYNAAGDPAMPRSLLLSYRESGVSSMPQPSGSDTLEYCIARFRGQ